ncbi:unnamed protein product [Blepharisma stoltei]|uniref:Metallo-beta-lactamase domain-containing protein n=1 Tax=Blepharisma stoltei TaxID=1481888 RepID=A0AAU9K634_9CILI|nr:unnamed protein product [Blepharisma stoltei]
MGCGGSKKDVKAPENISLEKTTKSADNAKTIPSIKLSENIENPTVASFFHQATNTICYVVACPKTKKCAVFDSVLDYDPVSLKTSTVHADGVIAYIIENNFEVNYIIDTHVHADHLTGSKILKEKYPNAKVCIGFNVTTVQKVFQRILNLLDLKTDGSQFDKLIKDNEEIPLGDLKIRGIYTPGHTPACMSYVVGDSLFTGDTIFMPDFGTARCDFPGGSADTLYDSIQKLFGLPDNFRVFVGHDYGTKSRKEAWETTMVEEKLHNLHLNSNTPREQFVKWRSDRDATLELPKLIMQSIQLNLRAGNFPPPEENGTSYFKLPINPKF